jgi:HD-GYP domain-containing protein (c-di-GMP phosphodiesterase class II)
MTAGRPYRVARTPEEALQELQLASGTQFDPEVVDAWCAAYTRRTLPAAA